MSTFIKKVSSAILATAVVLTAVGSTAGVSAAYTDVQAADYLAGQSVINDHSWNPALYELGNTLMKQEGIKVMEKISGRTIPTSCASSSFADVTTSDWVCKYAEDALVANFIAANTNLGPEGLLTKGQGLKMIMKAKGIEKTAGMTPWQAGYVDAAVAAGITATFSDYSTPLERGTFFVWAAEAIMPSEDDATDDLVCQLLGTCGDDVTVVEPETPVVETPVVSGDDMLAVSLNPETPSNGLASVNTARVPLLVFDVKAGSQDVTLNKATLEFIGLGKRSNLQNISIYNQKGEKVSKTKSFSDITREIKMDKDVVVEAGTTMTLTVAGEIKDSTIPYGDDNSTYGVKLIDLQASSNVEGEDLVGALLVGAEFNNSAKVDVTADKATGDITIGAETVLAGFEIEEKADTEDATIKTLTIHVVSDSDTTATADEDDLSNLALYADGTMVASDLEVNGDEEIVVSLDLALPADETIAFELKGTVVGSVGEDYTFSLASADDVYIIGNNSGMPIAVTMTANTIIGELDVEGSDINVAFTKSDIDEAMPKAEDVLIGTLALTTENDGYVIDTITVTVSGATPAVIAAAIEDLELGGEERKSGETGPVYTFEDFNLTSGTTELPLLLEVAELAANGTDLRFDISITKVTDENNDDKEYIGTALSGANSILSTNDFDNDLEIANPNITLAATDFYNRTLVMANNVTTVLYRWKVTVGDAGDVMLDDLNFKATLAYGDGTPAAGNNNNDTLDNLFKAITLNIGGQTVDADDINADGTIEFTNANLVIAAGSSNVEVMLTGTFGNADASNGTTLAVNYDATDVMTAETVIDDDIAVTITDTNAWATATANVGTTKGHNTTYMNDRGVVTITQVNNSDFEDDVETSVLAGSTNVAIAQLEMESEYEATAVEQLQLQITGDFVSTFTEVRLVSADGTLDVAEAAELVAWNTIISFENFVIPASDKTIDYKVVADIKSYSTEGDADVVNLNDINATLVLDTDLNTQVPAEYNNYKGEESTELLQTVTMSVTASDTVSLVPAMVIVSLDNEFAKGDEKAGVKLTISTGDNTLDDDEVTIKSIKFTSDVSTIFDPANTNVKLKINGDTATYTVVTDTITFAAGTEISTWDVLEFTVDATVDYNRVEILETGVKFTVDTVDYTALTVDENDVDLGRALQDN